MGYIDKTLLERYGHLLRTLDKEAEKVPPEDYLELLGPGEVDELLLIRNRIAEMDLSPEQESEVMQADDLLVKHHRLITEWLSMGSAEEPIAHWWWHLDKGPQVREKAREAA
ncbi:MAG: hypothetical protein M0T85_12555 [Dehalococcoidales bacterium]|nr:hypothetical protein [Dehalococcoidales bacterium]